MSDETQPAPGGKPQKRARGASFPAIPLGEAVTLVKEVASYGSTHTNAAVASFLGHTTDNSGPYRTKVAALKDFGLLVGRGDDLTVTPLALGLAHPGLDADTAKSMQIAFRSCTLFATVLDGLPKDRDLSVESLANSAMHNHGVATQAKDAFAKSFVKSGVAAGLLEALDGNRIRIPSAPQTATDSLPEAEADPAPPAREPGARSATPSIAPTPVSPTAVVNHGWPIAGGTIRFVIDSTRPLPANAYAVIGSVIEAGDRLAGMLGDAETGSADDGDSQ